MDKTWISHKRHTPEFQQGVKEFIRFAVSHKKDRENLCCPCKSCGNMGKVSTIDELRNHIFWNGFPKNYTEWIWHGEGLMSATNNDFEDPAQDSPNNEAHENYQLDEMLCSMGEGEMSDAFNVLRDCKTRWKYFKSRLTQDYFTTEKKNEVEHPPWEAYVGIDKDDWIKFKDSHYHAFNLFSSFNNPSSVHRTIYSPHFIRIITECWL